MTFGSDMELMLTKNGEYFSAIDIIKGSFKDRIKIDGHEFFWDNVLAEVAIKPGKTKNEVIDNFEKSLKIYVNMVRPYKLIVQASHDYPLSQLKRREAKIVGCKTDRCIYTMSVMQPPREAIKKETLRTCGGHIHLGDEILITDWWEPIIAIHLLDLFVGIPSILMDQDPTSPRRRKIYGQAGRYRVKNYGFEYRSLSNFWIKSPKLVKLIYDLCEFVINFVKNGDCEDIWYFDEEIFFGDETNIIDSYICKRYDKFELKKCLDSWNKKKAMFFMNLIKKYLSKKLYKEIQYFCCSQEIDFYKEWKLPY